MLSDADCHIAVQVTLVKATYLSDLHTEEKIALNAIKIYFKTVRQIINYKMIKKCF